MQYILVPTLLYLGALLSNSCLVCVPSSSPPCSASHVSVYCQLGSGPCIVQWLLCIHTYVHTVHWCLFCVHYSVESGTMYIWRTYVQYSTLCSVTYIQYMYVHYAIVHVHCVIVGVRYATAHVHCVIVGRYFFKKVHRYIVCTYVRTYIRMASRCTWCNASSLVPLMYIYKGIHDVM